MESLEQGEVPRQESGVFALALGTHISDQSARQLTKCLGSAPLAYLKRIEAPSRVQDTDGWAGTISTKTDCKSSSFQQYHERKNIKALRSTDHYSRTVEWGLIEPQFLMPK